MWSSIRRSAGDDAASRLGCPADGASAQECGMMEPDVGSAVEGFVADSHDLVAVKCGQRPPVLEFRKTGPELARWRPLPAGALVLRAPSSRERAAGLGARLWCGRGAGRACHGTGDHRRLGTKGLLSETMAAAAWKVQQKEVVTLSLGATPGTARLRLREVEARSVADVTRQTQVGR